MARTRKGLLAAGMLAGALLLGTVGLVAAADPGVTPTPSPVVNWPGGGQMNGQNMMNGQAGNCDPALMQSMHEQYHPTGN